LAARTKKNIANTAELFRSKPAFMQLSLKSLFEDSYCIEAEYEENAAATCHRFVIPLYRCVRNVSTPQAAMAGRMGVCVSVEFPLRVFGDDLVSQRLVCLGTIFEPPHYPTRCFPFHTYLAENEDSSDSRDGAQVQLQVN
jgi:hypothetical protein